MRKKLRELKFTLIELLVVVAIIAILMGILIPTVSKVREKAKITKAKGQMNAMVTAIKQYEATYGYLPVFGNVVSTESNYRRFIAYLTCAQGPGTATTDVNARKIRFLEPPGNYGTSTTAVKGTNTNAQEGDFYDPWGNLFRIYLDANYDGKVDSTDASGTNPSSGAVGGGSGFTSLNGTIFIYSYGPNKLDDNGKNALFGEGKRGSNPLKDTPKDDVCSWR